MTHSWIMFFTLLTSIFSSANNAASALEKVTKVADNAADNFLKEETIKAQMKAIKLEEQLAQLKSTVTDSKEN